MIPIQLQDDLINRVKKLFADAQYINPKYQSGGDEPQYIPINIYSQHLPEKKSSDVTLYPFVLIQLVEGEQSSADEALNTKIHFTIGIYDNDKNYQGYRDLCSVIQKIYEDLIRNPIENMRFELQFPISWFISDDNPFPYYFGGFETIWGVPKALREDVEEYI